MDYLKVPEVPEEHEEIVSTLIYDPTTYIAWGSCCYFEGQRYKHCGQTCGKYNNAGGGIAINAIDRCCSIHDDELQGKNPKPRCTAHKNLINCMKGLTGPGDTTIRTGIRADALFHGCGII